MPPPQQQLPHVPLPLQPRLDMEEGHAHRTRLAPHLPGRQPEVVGPRLGGAIARLEGHAASEEGVSLPLARSARDAISTVFYVRTLPLVTGDRYLIPVNEAGRNLVVDVSVAGRERITVQGRELAAIRLEPQMRRRVERRRPIAATLWVSDDDRKVPLALDLDANFGRVRLELVSYQR